MKYLKLVIPVPHPCGSIGGRKLSAFAKLEDTVKGLVRRLSTGGQSCLTAVIMALVCEAMSDIYAIGADTKATVKNFNKKCLQLFLNTKQPR